MSRESKAGTWPRARASVATAAAVLSALSVPSVLSVLAASSAALAAGAKVDARPGNWEVTIKVEVPGLNLSRKPVKTEFCLTEKDLVPPVQRADQGCKPAPPRISGNTVAWTLKCEDPNGTVTEGRGKVTYAGETFTGALDVTVEHVPVKYLLSGKRVGDCKKKAE